MGPATCNNFHGFLKSKVTRRRLSTGLNWYKKTTYDCTMESNSAIECCQNPEGSSCIETVCANRSNIVLANSRLTLEFARPEQEFGQEFGPQKSAEKSCNCTQYHLYKRVQSIRRGKWSQVFFGSPPTRTNFWRPDDCTGMRGRKRTAGTHG